MLMILHTKDLTVLFRITGGDYVVKNTNIKNQYTYIVDKGDQIPHFHLIKNR